MSSHAENHRRSIRLQSYDYRQEGAYFITICTHQRQLLFGEVIQGVLHPSVYGKIAHMCWHEIPRHFPHVELDVFVVMPNHIHGILFIVDDIISTRDHTHTRFKSNTHPLFTSNTPSKTGDISHVDDISRMGDMSHMGDVSHVDDISRMGDIRRGLTCQAPTTSTPTTSTPTTSTPATSTPATSKLNDPALNDPTSYDPASHHPTSSFNKRQFGKPIAGSLSTIVGAYKSSVTRIIRQTNPTMTTPVWQRNYYEHIIRDEEALINIRHYIQNNPEMWERDKFYSR